MKALLLAAALVLAFPRAALPADDPFVIPAILSLTGGVAFLGKAEEQTLHILERSINRSGGIKGRPVHFDIQDDQSRPQVAVQLTNGILATHAPVILGSDLSSNCNAMVPLTKDDALVYCFSPGPQPDPGSYYFSAGVAAHDIFVTFVRYLRAHGLHRIGAIFSTDVTGQDGERQLNALLALPEYKGLQLVVDEHFNPTDLSVTAQMAHVAGADSQVCLCWTTGSGFTTLLRAYTEAGLKIPVFTQNKIEVT